MLAQRASRVDSIVYLLFLTAHIGLVWMLLYFPTQDGPSHLYNLAILNDLLHGGGTWSNYYSYSLRAVPNLGFHLVAYPLLQLFPPLITEKIFLTIYILLMASCVPFFLRTFDKELFPLSFLVFPVLFNSNLMMGFYSYTLAVPLFLLAISIIWRFREAPLFPRFLLPNMIGLALFYFHLIPFVFFLIFLCLMLLLDGMKDSQVSGKYARFILTAGPLLSVLVLHLARNGVKVSQGFSYLASASRLIGLSSELLLFSTASLSEWQLLPSSMLILVLYRSIKEGSRSWRHSGNIPPSVRLLLAMTVTLLLIYFLAPFHFGGGGYFNTRLPWVILLLSLPLLQVPAAGPGTTGTLIAVAILFLAVNAISLRQQTGRVKDFLGAMRVEIPKGAFVASYSPQTSAWPRVDPLLHAISYYCMTNESVDIANYETRYDYFPVHFQKFLPSSPSPEQIALHFESIDWAAYPSTPYVYGWNTNGSEKEKLMPHFQKVWERGALSLWKGKTPSPGQER